MRHEFAEAGKSNKKAVRRNRLLALEPRMLFDGAAPAIVDKATDTRAGKEDDPSGVTISNLSITDAENDHQSVTLTATHGKVSLQSTSGLAVANNGTSSVQLSGSLADINAALNGMKFVSDADFNGAAKITVQTNDGSNTVQQDVNLTIAPVNDAPTFTGTGTIPSVDEGGTLLFTAPVDTGQGFTNAQLGLTDVDNSAEQVILKITQVAAHGKLVLSENGQDKILTVGSTLSASELGNLRYVHDGTQVLAPDTLDTFKVNIDDGAGALLTDQTISIHLQPVNQAPDVTGTISIVEGQQGVSLTANDAVVAGVINTPRGRIDVSDPDDSTFTYKLAGLPTHGTLYYDGAVITDANFAFSDLSKLTYSHDGSEPTYSTDGFDLIVTDHGGGTGDAGKSTTAHVTLNILPNDNDPVLVNDVRQTLNPGESTRTLDSGMLKVTDSDSLTITYTVTALSDPNLGYFTRDGLRMDVGSTFTQADIDGGKIQYTSRTSSASARTDWMEFTVKDGDVRFYPTVRDGGIYTDATGTTLQQIRFNVDVPPATGDGGTLPGLPPTYTGPVVGGTTHLDVVENNSGTDLVTITQTQLHTTDDNPIGSADMLTYRLLTVPSGGVLLLNGQALGQFDSFTQADIDAGRVQYRNSGGEVFRQSFEFTVSDGDKVTATKSFSISVRPQNDTPTASLGPKVPAVSEGQQVTIDNQYIVLNDADGQGDLPDTSTQYAIPNDLVFTITGDVSHGELTLNGVAIHVGDTVTAAQLAAGMLKYTHDGSETSSDSFKLVPQDDQGVGATAGDNQSSTGAELVVNIIVNPVNDAPVFAGKSEATGANAIYEGGSVTIRGDSSQGPVYLKYTDTDNNTIQRQYRITTTTAHGRLLLNGVVLGVGSVFTQADLDSGALKYVHDATDTRDDSFQYVVSDGDFRANETDPAAHQGDAIASSTFNIEIKPVNDAPTVDGPTNPVKIGSSTSADNGVPGFTVGDPDIGALDGTDFMQVTVRLLDKDGNALQAADYTAGGNIQLLIDAAGAGVSVIGHGGNGDYLVFQGTRDEVNAALNSLKVLFPDSRNGQYQLQVIADDRMRDTSGNLTGTANGGDANQAATRGDVQTAIPTDPVDGTVTAIPSALKGDVSSASVKLLVSQTDEAPTLTTPGPATVDEDVSHNIGGGFTVADPESTNLDLPITVTLSVAGGHGSLGIAGNGTQTTMTLANGHTVTIGGDNTGTLTLTGRADDIESLLNDSTSGLTYLSPANGNADYNAGAPGDVTVHVSLDEGAAAVGDNLGSNYSPSGDIFITLNPTNDAPVVSAGTGTIVADQGGVEYPITGVSVTDPDVADGIDPGETDFEQVTVRLLDQNGVPLALAAYAGITLDSADTSGGVQILSDGSGKALIIQGDAAAVNNYLAQLRIKFDPSVANADKQYQIQVIADDRLRDGSGALDGSNQANGGPNIDGAGTGVAGVPTTAIDPYDTLPGGLDKNVDVATRTLFVSGVNDPAQIDASDVSDNESTGTVTIPAGTFNVTDSDSIAADGSPGSNLSATIHVDKGLISATGAWGGVVTGSGTDTITITGATLTQINAWLDHLQVQLPTGDTSMGSVDWNGTFHMTVSVNDGGNSGQRPATLPGDTDNPASNPGDYSYNDGTSAQLITTRTITVTVNPVNDAPTRTDGTPATLSAVSEDAGTTPPGDTVQNLFGSKFQDGRNDVTNGSTHNDFAGIAITGNAATAAQGTWEYSLDGGTTWVALPAVSDSGALLLGPSDMLRFVAKADYSGTPGALTAHLVDSSAPFADGGTADVSTTGGTTQFSVDTVTLQTSVTAVNDAPVLSGPGSISTHEDVDSGSNTGSTVGAIVGGLYSDNADDQSGITGGADNSTALEGIVIVGNTADAATQGKWQYSVSPGVWVDVPAGAALGANGTAIYLPKDASLRFQPAADYHGAPPSLTFSAVDGSAGTRTTVETGITLTAFGGTSQYSDTKAISATVTPVNDAPDFTGLDSGTPVAVKGGSAVNLDADGVVHAGDVDLDVPGGSWDGVTLTVQRQGGADTHDVFAWNAAAGITTAGSTLLLNGVAVGTFTSTGGTLNVTFNSAADAAAVGTIIGAVTYRNTDPSTAASPNVNIDFTLNDQDSNAAGGGTAGSGQDQGTGGQLLSTHTVAVQIDTSPQSTALPDKAQQDKDNVVIDTGTAFSDPDAGDTLTYGVTGLPSSLSIDPATGQITGTLDHSDSQGGAGGVYTVTVTATDSHGASTSKTFTLTVTNPAPVAQDDTNATTADASATGNVISTPDSTQADSDSDGDTLTVVQVGGAPANVGHAVTGSHGGTFTLNADGSYTFDPGHDFDDLAQGSTRTTDVTYQISDGEGGTATATLVITVTGVNAAPTVAATLPDKTGTDSLPITISTSSGFSDIDVGDSLSYSANGLPPGLTIDAATGEITGTPQHSASQGGSGGTTGGVYTITITATDTHGASVSQDFTLTIGNPAPVAQDDFGQTDSSTVSTGNVIVGATVPEHDSDPDGDTLHVAQAAGDAANIGKAIAGDHGGRFTLNADGSYSFDPNGDFADLDIGQTRTTSITYQVSDGEGGTSTAVLTITVTGLNDPPVAQADHGQTDAVTPTSGNAISGGDASQADSDPEGDTLTVVSVNGDAGNVGQSVAGDHGGRFVLNADGSYTFDPNGEFTGLARGATATTQITYAIEDGHGHSATTTITVTVVGTNDAPTATGDIPDRSDIDGSKGVQVDVSHAFDDADGDHLTYTATGLPPGMTMDPATGLITGTLDHSASNGGKGGSYTVAVTATDPDGASVTRTFTWQVTNPAPKADPDSGTTPNDTPLKGDVLPNDSDPDGDTLTVQTFTVDGVPGTHAAGDTVLIPNVGTLTLNADGSYTFVAADRYAGNVPLVTYHISDGEGGTADSTLQITVTQTNHVLPLPPDATVYTGSASRGALAETLQTLVYGQEGYGSDLDGDPDTGGVLHIEYLAIRPEVIRITRGPSPSLFVTYAVRESQEAAVLPQELGTIESQLITERLKMSPDLHVLLAVGASQRDADILETDLAVQRHDDIPGANPLFNDFDPLSHLVHRPGRDAAHATSQRASAPSFTQQLNRAANAARPPAGAAKPAPTNTSRN